MTDDAKLQGLVPAGPSPRAWSLVPTTLGEAMEIAEKIAGSEFAPKDYRGKPVNIMIAIQMGLDVGLKPMQALQNIAVINGRPSIWGDAALALCAPDLERFHETISGQGDERTATCIAKRKGWPDETIRTFSVADAKRAGLWGKTGPWTTYPDRMLQMRARGFTLRDTSPDRLMGLSIAEEAMDIEATVTAGTPESVPVAVPSVEVFSRLPEPLQQKINEAFAHLSFSEAHRLMKLNEYFVPEKDPEEQAVALIEWCKDEYAKRKFGKPRAKVADGDNGRKAKDPKPVGASSTQAASGTAPPPARPTDPAPPSGDITPSSDEIF